MAPPPGTGFAAIMAAASGFYAAARRGFTGFSFSLHKPGATKYTLLRYHKTVIVPERSL